MKKKMTVALISMKHRLGDPDFNLERHRYWVERAMEKQPDFIGFPEFSLTGWVEDAGQALPLSSKYVKEVESLARRHRVTIATGLVEKRAGRLFNACVIEGPQERAGVMRKINLIARESRFYQSGREFPVFETAGCRLGVATCADASYFEMIHLLALRGAEIIFAPHANSLNRYGNNPAGWIRWRMEEWPAYARRACVAIAGMSCSGLFEKPVPAEEETKYCGGAMVMDWKGKPIVRAGGSVKKERMLFAEIDLQALRKARKEHDQMFRASIIYNRKEGWARGYG